jgi:hypothetical protein
MRLRLNSPTLVHLYSYTRSGSPIGSAWLYPAVGYGLTEQLLRMVVGLFIVTSSFIPEQTRVQCLFMPNVVIPV